MTALMVAASKDDPATVEALAAAGAKLHARAENGQTAMMMAAQRGHVAAVRALKQAGAEK
jgi:ankyrin repeat protein